MPEESLQQMLAKALRDRIEREKSKLPTAMDPLKGMDAQPTIMAPTMRQEPWVPKISTSGASLSLPTNKGANFEAYADYKLNPFKPQNNSFNGLGVRYRWDF